MKNYWRKGFLPALLVLMILHSFSILPSFAEEQQENEFSPEEEEYLQHCPELKVGYVCDRKPVSFQDENGEFAGISRTIFDRISEISGLTFEYVPLPTGQVTYDYLLGENFDFVTSVEYNEENQKARGILISNPYLSSKKMIVTKENFQFSSQEHFQVAISTGSQTIKKVLARYYPNFELVDYPSTEACFDAVNKGEVDLLIQNQYVVEYWLYKPSYDELKIFPLVEMNDQLCFSAVTPITQQEENAALWHEKEMQISIINKTIAQLTDDELAGYILTGVMDNMYHYTYSDILYQYRYTAIAIGIALVLIAFLLYMNTQFRIRSIHDRADAKAKGEFLSAMSHEIRTPLNGLVGLNYMMTQHMNDSEKLSDYLQQSASIVQYLQTLVNNILDMSMLQENRMQLHHTPINLMTICDSIENAEKESMIGKGIHLIADIELPFPIVLSDEIRIRQILVNILDNARKYTSKGGRIQIKIRQERISDSEIYTAISISDTGQGMSEEFQKKIFDPFTQERETVSTGNQGTGLGLAICYLLAKSMGGNLTVKSKLGEGSCFTFTFSAEPSEIQEEIPVEKREEITSPEEKPHILVAEDNELNAEILIELLTEAGFEVAHAPNGKKAVELFQSSKVGEFGVILMDILMPELNGTEATKIIRNLNRPDAETVKIIACTANSLKEDEQKALESGMDDFIPKPIDIPLLLQKLSESPKNA